MERLLLNLLLLSCWYTCQAQDNYPIPTSKKALFYIQHDQGYNTYVYEINTNTKGTIIQNKPIKIHRQLFDEDGKVKPLTYLQNKFAYGLQSKVISDEKYEITLAAYPNQKLYLTANNKEVFVSTKVNGIDITLTRIFLKQQEGTSGLGTKLDYILFYGKDSNNRDVVQKLSF